MLAERGVNVDHTTIYRWVQRYAPEMEKRLRWYWRNPSGFCSWHLDETYMGLFAGTPDFSASSNYPRLSSLIPSARS